MVDCGQKTGKGKAVATFRIPAIISHQGNETEELTRERRVRWISALSRDDLTELKLQNERVCSRHFVACEQALLFEQAKRASRERASEGPRKGELATISQKFSFPPRKPRDSAKRENCHRKRAAD